MTARPSFFSELQRRHVYKVGAMYAVAGWLFVQIITQVFPIYDISAHVQRIFVGVIVAGFPVALMLAWLFDLTPAGIVLTESQPSNAEAPTRVQHRHSIDRKLNYVFGFLLLISLCYLMLDLRFQGRTPAASKADSVDDKSIAVLPFENLSSEADNAYFATGMQDEILTRLSKIRALKVISRTSTQHFASSPNNLPEIAAKLGVSAILEGSVEKIGNAVHINVQLIRAATDAHLWAESYNRKLDDVFAVQGEVAQAVATALSATLTGAEAQQIAERPTRDTRAYEAYLRGLALEGRFSAAAGDFRKRAAAYQQAVDLDPGFAQAWAGLASANTELYLVFETTPAQLMLAKQALDEAVRLAPNSSETWEAVAFYHYYGLSDYVGAFEAYAKALESRPSAGRIVYAMGNVRRRQGRWQEALELQTRAASLDPLSTQSWYNLALTMRALHRYDEAEAALNRGLAAVPDDPSLLAQKARTAQMRGDFNAADTLAEKLPLDSDDPEVLQIRLDQWRYRQQSARAIREIQQLLQRTGSLTDLDREYLLQELGAAEGFEGDRTAAAARFAESMKIIEALRKGGNESSQLDGGLAIDAAMLGDCKTAYRSADLGARKVEKDALIYPLAIQTQAFARARCGDSAQAVVLLTQMLELPNAQGLSVEILRVDPIWDVLRGDPGFQKLLAAPPPLVLESAP